jgi:hypothetical protein
MLHTLTTIRAATAADADALARLADSDRARRLRGRVLIAEGDQGVIAAIVVASGAASIRNLPERVQEDRIPSAR